MFVFQKVFVIQLTLCILFKIVCVGTTWLLVTFLNWIKFKRLMQYWWSTINTFMKSDIKSPIPPLNVDDTVIYSEQEKANAFNDFFVSQTKLENNNQECPFPPVYNFREHLTDIELNIKPVIFVRYYNRFL